MVNKDKLRRSLLYVSGASPANMIQAPYYGADCLIYDLEDSVSMHQKDIARFLVFNALKAKRHPDLEYIVRVNALDSPYGHEDLEAMVRAKPDIIRFPKIETAADVEKAVSYIESVEKAANIELGSTKIIAGMESHIGVLNAQAIAKASERIIAISIGGEDFTASMKTSRSVKGLEMFFARNAILLAARAAGVQAIDTIYANIEDEQGLKEDTEIIKNLGFDGKYLIHPKQIEIVNNVFNPTEKEIAKALRIYEAMQEALAANSGVIVLDGNMVDAPIVARAKHTLSLAIAAGLIAKEEIAWI